MKAKLELQDIYVEWQKILPYLQQNAPNVPLELLFVPPLKRRKLERRYVELKTFLARQPENVQQISSVFEHPFRMIREALSVLDRRRTARRTVITLVAAAVGLAVGLISLVRHWN
jgi:hypothetical protein